MSTTVILLLCSLLFVASNCSPIAEGNAVGAGAASDDWNGRSDWNRVYMMRIRMKRAAPTPEPSTEASSPAAEASPVKGAPTNPFMAFQERRVARGGFDSLMGYGFTGFDRRRRVFDALHGFGFDGFN